MQNKRFTLYHALTLSLLAISVLGWAHAAQAATVYAKNYGFNAQDATAALQAAINSGADKVIVSNMGSNWIVKPIFLASNQEIVFESGTVVEAKQGEFHGTNDCLFTGDHKSNITITATGATFKMHREDYTGGAYSYSQWRHVFYMLSCDQVTFQGGTYRDSGGDGIFIGSFEGQPACTNFHVQNVLCDNNYRQGISVTNAENLVIEDSQMNNTWGQEPQAGIDFEPDGPSHRLVNCVVRNCRFLNNNKSGILVYPQMLNANSSPLSITFDRCYVTSANGWGLQISPLYNNGPTGFIEFKDCVIEDVMGPGLYMPGKAAYRALVKFTRTTWRRVAKAAINGFPAVVFCVTGDNPGLAPEFGGMLFTDCTVDDQANRVFFQALVPGGSAGLTNVKGNIAVLNPYGARYDFGSGAHDNNLVVTTQAFTPTPAPSASKTPGATATPAPTSTPTPGVTVYAKDYGFDAQDATDALQAAINSGADRVVVSNLGKDWIIKPITLASNQELVFEPGVAVTAKSGEYHGLNDSLFTADHKSKIKVKGAENVVLKMRKQDYTSSAYEDSQWRHGFYIMSCDQVEISNLTVQDTGGDGIFIGSFVGQAACTNVKIANVVCDNNYRQGISVTNAENLVIDGCVLKNTSGHDPEAGIDFEPDGAAQHLVNCVVRNTRFEDNNQASVMIYSSNLNNASDLDLTFENCTMSSQKGWGIQISRILETGPDGSIVFRNCTISDVRGPGLFLDAKSAYRTGVTFDNCQWKNLATGSVSNFPSVPLYLSGQAMTDNSAIGGLEFKRCVLQDEKDRPFLLASTLKDSSGVANVKGDIVVLNPNGARMDLGVKTQAISLTVKTALDVPETPTSVPTAAASASFCVYPNPARDRLNIRLDLQEPERVLVSLFNVAGEKVREIAEQIDPSYPVISCEVRNMATGVYYYLVKQKSQVRKGRFAIIR